MTAFMLGAIHGGIGTLGKGLQIRAVAWIKGNADRAGYVQIILFYLAGFGNDI